MTALYFQAVAAIAVALSLLMAGVWVVQQRTGNSGWVDSVWTFSLGLGAGSALWPWGWATLLAPAFLCWILVHVTGVPPREEQMLRSLGDRYRDYRRARVGSFRCRRRRA